MIDGAVLAVLACAAPLVATYLFFFSIPNLQHSRFRHALWDVRDAIVDDVIDGRLELNRATRELLTTVHLAIRYAPEHTMRSGFTSLLLLRGQTITPLDKVLRSKAVPLEQQNLLIAHYDRLQTATVRHLLFGSPSGWLSLIAIGLNALFRRHRRSVQDTAKTELSSLSKLYPDVKSALTRRDLACAV